MSRRARNDEIELGSDSFLDIIANIVGILIILIVIAGVKVSRQPVTAQPEPTASDIASLNPEPLEAQGVPPQLPDASKSIVDPKFAAAPALPTPDAESESAAQTQPSAPRLATPLPPARYVSEPQEPTQPRAILANAFQKKEDGLKQFAKRSQIMNTEVTRLASMQQQAAETLDAKQQATTAAQTSLASLQHSITDKRSKVSELRRRLARPKTDQVSVNQIEHKVTPVGKAVTGAEVHFRLAAGKVSYIPVDELVNELKTDAGRKQSMLSNTNSYRGRVGPIKGYRMKYEIVRKRRALSDDLRFGATVFRAAVNEWEVEPTPNLEEETVRQAQRVGSLFDRRLLTLPRDANVTFWVYPDSFTEYRALQSRVHQEGLTVAGRPLPFGVAIAGSPNGTKSSGQ